jgi:hypothetical protein
VPGESKWPMDHPARNVALRIQDSSPCPTGRCYVGPLEIIKIRRNDTQVDVVFQCGHCRGRYICHEVKK